MWGTRWPQRVRLGPLYLALHAADALATRSLNDHPGRDDYRPGVSIVIPDRDAADMLAAALASVDVALQPIDEPKQVIVVANGAPESAYAEIRAAFAHVEFVHSDLPLGFGTAIARGLARV